MAEVGRRLEKVGGPKTQSLRNAQGAPYRDIITAYANAVFGATRYVAKTKSNVEQALDLITDPSIRETLRMALDDAKRLKVVNDNLHAAFKSLQVGASLPSSAAIVEPAPRLSGPGTGSELLSSRLLSALRKGIDASRLAQQGMHVADDGSIENEHRDKLFPPAFVTAIQTVLPPA